MGPILLLGGGRVIRTLLPPPCALSEWVGFRSENRTENTQCISSPRAPQEEGPVLKDKMHHSCPQTPPPPPAPSRSTTSSEDMQSQGLGTPGAGATSRGVGGVRGVDAVPVSCSLGARKGCWAENGVSRTQGPAMVLHSWLTPVGEARRPQPASDSYPQVWLPGRIIGSWLRAAVSPKQLRQQTLWMRGGWAAC